MRKKIFIVIIPSLLLILMTLVITVPSALGLELPSSMEIPANYVKVFRNLVETGDMLYVFEYNIAFTSDNFSDNISASESFIFRLYDTDNVTVLATATPYAFPFFDTNGYSHGVSGFYFANADTKPAWGSAVKIELYGLPTYFTPAQSCNYTLTASNYTSSTTQEANQTALYNYILLETDRLTKFYDDTGVILQGTSDTGMVLSNYGENYFRGAIPGIQTLCPSLFYIQVYVPTRMDSATSYNMSLGDTYTARHATSDFGKGFTRIGEAMGVSGAFAGAGICFVLCIVVCIYFNKKGWSTEFGMFISAIICTFFAVTLGNIVFTVLMIIALLAAMGLVWMFLLKRT